ncbi:MAG TPA: 16S rRNA (cytosine(967)-C(5))-methyltransferase RsmB [Thermoleophilaceae bacterium]|nr:16S rRNA (cytosine(967)-C(5))-methyltransferase RsmB [Thermoleophilaceae bacterium]
MTARQVAFRVVRRVSDGAYADRAFRAEAARAGLSSADRAFAQVLAYGTIQRRLTLDHVIQALSDRSLRRLDPPLLDALRLGVYQLLFMDSVPDHAAVAETVELAKSATGAGHKFANAVLRRATREARAIIDGLDDSTPGGAAIRHSHPQWLVELWWEMLGREETLALLDADNHPAEDAVRVNTLVADSTPDIPGARADPELPEALVLEQPFDVEGSELFASGAVTPQSRASMLVARTLDPQPGDKVLDMCAAPGTKTTHATALMRNEGQVTAVEANAARADELRANCKRMYSTSVSVIVEDARTVQEQFDRVMLDAPCSNLGTLARRPDARWRKTPEQIADLAALQRELLDAAADATRPGGTLVYSVCTISGREGPSQLDSFKNRHPDFSEASRVQTLPHRDGTDGFFIARLERSA